MNIKIYIKNTIQIFSLIFTVVLLSNLFFGHGLTNFLVFSIFWIAIISAFLSIVFYDVPPFNRINPLLLQVLYLIFIIGLVNGTLALFYNKININALTMISNSLLVLVVYVIIRWVTYTEDKKEAEKINKMLEQMREEK